MHNVASTYAKVLLQRAIKTRVLEHVYVDVICFNQVYATNESLGTTLKNPVIKHDKKLAVLQAIFQNQVHDLTLRFFAMVTQKHREMLLSAIAQSFLVQYAQYKGITTAQVTTTFPLPDKVVLQLQQIVQRIAHCQKVILEQHINPDLIGGYVLQVADKRLDQSLRKKLLTFKNACMANGHQENNAISVQ